MIVVRVHFGKRYLLTYDFNRSYHQIKILQVNVNIAVVLKILIFLIYD